MILNIASIAVDRIARIHKVIHKIHTLFMFQGMDH